METSEDNQMARKNRRTVQASTAISRRCANRPAAKQTEISVQKSPAIQHFNRAEQFIDTTDSGQMEDLVMEGLLGNPANDQLEGRIIYEAMKQQETPPAQKINVVVNHAATEKPRMKAVRQITVNEITRTEMRQARNMANTGIMVRPKTSAKELKEQAIQKALVSASKTANETTKSKKKARKSEKAMHFGFGRVMLALSCALAAVAAIVYFVALNTPDLSLKVAAMQAGIDATTPGYVPRNYSPSGVTSKEGEIKIEYVNSVDNKKFTLIEEKSSWDTNALLTNYVKVEYGDDYTTIKEQGLTIYISESNAAWVNGGNVYKIEATNGTLTNKQIKSIAVSL